MDIIKAIVQIVIASGPHGPYAVATSKTLEGSVTFSLEPTVWQEEDWPEAGNVVLLSRIRRKRAGWRAKAGRYYLPSDEQPEKSKDSTMQQITSDVLTQHPWLNRYINRGGIVIKGVTADGVLNANAPEQHLYNNPYGVEFKELRVSGENNLSDKMQSLRHHKDPDLNAPENFLDEAHFLREDGQEIAFYDAGGNYWGPWSENQTDPGPWSIGFETVVRWVVCIMIKSAKDWLPKYLLVYRVVRH